MNIIQFYVNEKKCEITDPDPNLRLVSYIRNHLGLKGTKLSCGENECGACTVTLSKIDATTGKIIHLAINSCSTLVCSLHNTVITTVEGLGSTKKGLHPIQETIYKSHGSQCGFCTPGMVMSMSSYAKEKPILDIEDIELAIQGNLCRCTGYRPIVEGFTKLTNNNKQQNDSLYSSEKNTTSTKLEFPQVDESFLIQNNQSMNFQDKWYRPANWNEFIELRNQYEKVDYFAGGTGRDKLSFSNNSPVVIQINHLEELSKIVINKNEVIFGSCVTLNNVYLTCLQFIDNNKKSAVIFRELSQVLKKMASMQVKNVATLGGHLIWAHPSSDIIPILLATRCKIEVLRKDNSQEVITLDESFFPDSSKTLLNDGDLILNIRIPFNEDGDFIYYFKQARRKGFDLSIGNVAFFGNFSKNQLNIVAGGVEGSFPGLKSKPAHHLHNVESYILSLKDKNFHFERSVIAQKVFSDLFTDPKAPEQLSTYRKCLIAGFVEKFIRKLKGDKEISIDEQKIPLKSQHVIQKTSSDQPDYDPIYRPIPHEWSAEQASGEAVYVDDMRKLTDETHLVCIQSTKAHALVKEIDFSQALKVPGVIGTVTADDIPGEKNFGVIVNDEPILATHEVLHMGQAIAALVCTNYYNGLRARKLVKVVYEDLPNVIYYPSIKNTSDPNQLVGPWVTIKKDQGVKFDENSVKTISGTVQIGSQEHVYLEPQAVLAVPSGEKDELTLTSNTQNIASLQKAIALALNLPKHKINIRCKRLGGGFGGKERHIVSIVAAIAARKFQRPVRGVLTMKEDIDTTGHRHPMTADYILKVDPKSGIIVDADFNFNINGGCSMDLSMLLATICLLRVSGGYSLKKFNGVSKALRTNQVSNTPMRGFGGPESMLVIETAIAHVANELKMDIKTIQEANMVKEGDLEHYGDDIPHVGCNLGECWNECLKLSKYDDKRKAIEKFNKENKIIKRGISLVPVKFAPSMGSKFLMQGGALVVIYNDGSVLIHHGGIEMGQGLHTKMLQVAAHALDIPLSKVYSAENSTSSVPNSTSTGGTTGTDLNGAAIIDACEQINKRLDPIKKRMSDKTWEEWIGAAYMDNINLSAFGFYTTDIKDGVSFDAITNSGKLTDYWMYGAGCISVEVNCHTGAVSILSTDIVIDVGKSLNPAIDIGQIEGAFIQGFGFMTMEQHILSSDNGDILTSNLGSYKIPSVADIPREVNIVLLKPNEKKPQITSTVYSSKGIGEPPILIATGIPIAIREAISSYRKDHGNYEWFTLDVPLTVDKIRMAARDEYIEEIEKQQPTSNKFNKLGFEL